MTIKELLNMFKDTSSDRTLVKDLEILASITYVPKEPLMGEYIKLQDETGELDAASTKRQIYDLLKPEVGKKKKLKLKGRLDKTEFDNIAFSIEEILD